MYNDIIFFFSAFEFTDQVQPIQLAQQCTLVLWHPTTTTTMTTRLAWPLTDPVSVLGLVNRKD